MSGSLELDYNLSQADVEAWWQYSATRNATYKANHAALAVLAAGGGYWVGAHFDLGALASIGLLLLGFLAGWGLAVLWTRLSLRDLATLSSRSAAAQLSFGPHHLALTVDGLAERGPAASHTHSWSAVEALWETPDHFFLAVGGGGAYVIPKRAFPTPESQAALRRLVASRVDEAQYTPPRASSV